MIDGFAELLKLVDARWRLGNVPSIAWQVGWDSSKLHPGEDRWESRTLAIYSANGFRFEYQERYPNDRSYSGAAWTHWDKSTRDPRIHLTATELLSFFDALTQYARGDEMPEVSRV